MSFVVPIFYRWVAIFLIALAFGGFCWVKGANNAQVKFDKLIAIQAKAETELLLKRVKVTEKVDQKFQPQLTRIRTITKETIKEVPVYVSKNDCPMSGGFRLLHDAAAKGQLPDSTGIADAATVSADSVASTVAENYGTCLETAKRLEGLQDWTNEQLKLNK